MTRAAIYVETNEPLVVEELVPNPPGPRDVVVALEASGVCHSDVSVAHGYYGSLFPKNTILGHEGTGTVVEVGSEVQALKPGDRVVGSSVPACGLCWFCRHDESYLCDMNGQRVMRERGTRAGGEAFYSMGGLGTFADTMICHEASVVKVETDLPAPLLALLGCAVATGVGAVINTAAVRPGEGVAVIGCGGIGQSVIQGARIAGAAPIIAIDPVDSKRSDAQRLGATHVVDPGQGDVVEQVRALTEGRGIDYAFEVVGSPAVVLQACEMIRKGGTAVALGATPTDAALELPNFLSFRTKGKTLKGSVYGSTSSRRDFQALLRLVETGRLDLESMVSRTIGLNDINEAFSAIDRGEGGIRTIITSYS